MARALVAGITAFAALAGTAQAAGDRSVEPLNQYLVSGRISADQLGRAGYDLQEALTPVAKGKYAIVATPSQARALEDKGATVEAPFGVARTMVAPASPLTDPVHGYDVFRPWSLRPAPCPTTCSTPLVPLKDWYHGLAARYRDVVKEETIGRSILGQPIMAYKITSDARERRDGSRPVALFESTQHAREWISTEVNRRLFQWVLAHRRDRDMQRLLDQNELWFIPMMNPDGYDYTFTSKATRLWRKNLRDVNGDGQIDPAHDGVDPNRNWPEKWNYDLEGASNDPSTETFHGAGPASEPEVAASRALHQRLKPKFLIDYHSFAQLILYPEGWQVETPSTDAPLMAALAGNDDKPAVTGFDPDVAAELYTTNGDVTGDAYNNWGTQAYTVELDGGAGADVGGTVNGPDSLSPGGFVFQDDEAAVEAEFQKNVAFALDLVKSARRPDQPQSHLGNTAPEFVPTTFSVSYGDPQTIEVNAKRSLGRVRAFWQVNGGRVQRADTTEYAGGKRYGKPGIYYHRLRGSVTGTRPGDSVKVWFGGGDRTSSAFTYTVKSASGNPVLLLTAEDYTGRSSDVGSAPYPGPLYQADYEQALQTAGVGYDVYDVDTNGRSAASALGVLSHYRAVIWQTGEDLYVREPTQPGGTGVSKLLDDEVIAARDYLNDGGKLLVAGKFALQGGWDQFLYNPLGAPPNAFCNSNQTQGNGDADDPAGQNYNCVAVSNDFQQYWLGAYLPITAAADPAQAAALPFQEAGSQFGTLPFGVNGTDSKANQDNVYSFLTTSSVLPQDRYPQFASRQAIKFNRPPSFDPPTGTHYAFSGAANQAYKRLTKTIDLTGKTAADLSFKVSYDTEPNWDYLFVEAHTVGQDDWTTLPDANGHTSSDMADNQSCPQIPITEMHPFLSHYMTYHGPAGGSPDATCDNTGTSGAWNAATGNSGGFQDWKVDLHDFAGKQVEVSITYISDPAVQGLGVFVDDATVTADGATLAQTSFEDGLGGWGVPGAPDGSPGNANDWAQSTSVGYVDGPGVATADTLYWGFGLEGVSGAGDRATLLKDALKYLGAAG